MAISAKDVQALRQATGAGMMDAKRALEDNNGDFEAAKLWLRERGLGKAAERSDRDNAEGCIALARNGNIAALVQLKSETDFVAKSPDFVNLANDIAQALVDNGEGAVDAFKDAIDDAKITLKENIELGAVARFEAPVEESAFLKIPEARDELSAGNSRGRNLLQDAVVPILLYVEIQERPAAAPDRHGDIIQRIKRLERGQGKNPEGGEQARNYFARAR